MPTLNGAQGNALASLNAVNRWIETLNASVSGAAKTGYKANKITFGGGITETDKLPQNGALGVQYAEQALNVGSTNIDFSEGQVVASTEYTHLALSGSQNAFFLLTDATVAYTDNTSTRYYAREGEFHLDSQGFIRSKDGLYLLGKNSGGGYVKMQINIATDPDPEATMAKMIENHNLTQTPTNVGTDTQTLTHSYVTDLSSLQYSKYGSQVFVYNGAPNKHPATVLDEQATGPGSNVRIAGNSLEASNVDLPSSLVELSLAQKIYTALTKVIQIDQQKMDNILTLIR